MNQREKEFELQKIDVREAEAKLKHANALLTVGCAKIKADTEVQTLTHSKEIHDLRKAVALASAEFEREQVRLKFAQAAKEMGCEL